MRLLLAAAAALGGLLLVGETASAQTLDLNALLPQGAGSVTGRIVQIAAVITVLSLAPGLMVMVTSFTRFAVALSFLRSGIGLQSTPANLVLVSLALFMTFFVMSPVFEKSWNEGLRPLMDNEITEQEAYGKIVAPFREFMLSQVRDKDLAMFEELARTDLKSPDRATTDLRVLIPAFMISELRRGFEIGFLIVLPFLVIDMIVSTLTMSMGMMMLPPSVIALPLKVLFFVLIDGWNMVIGSLIRSYG
ncbi:MAG: flagellar type III secretion system pore protein FliP [Beijerinckiaceae bacterium]|nr:flagellar type III secretion system pore protein FliP [Beijerinckiaceae bacterium]